MLGFQWAILTFTVPALAGGAISGERERQTLDTLLITKMRYDSIIWGKLLGSLFMVCIMIVASMPCYAVIFYYGGVNILEFLADVGFTLVYSMLLGSIALYFSTRLKKTTAAIFTTYLVVFIICFVLPIIFLLCNISSNRLGEGSEWITGYLLLTMNPIVNFTSIVDLHMGGENISMLFGGDSNSEGIPVCYVNAVISVLVTVLLTNASAKNINPLKKNNKKGAK